MSRIRKSLESVSACMCLVCLLSACNISLPYGTSSNTDALATALRTCNYDGILSAAEEGANMDDVIIDGQHKNPVLYLWEQGPRTIFMEQLLKGGADVNYADEDGITLLMYASGAKPQEYSFVIPAQNRSVFDYCKLFLSYGADVAATDNQGWTALDYAVQAESNIDTVNLLLSCNAKVSPKTLSIALSGVAGYSDYLKIQLLASTLIENGEETQLNPIVEATLLGQSKNITSLLSQPISCSEEEKVWALCNAIVFCNKETVQRLLLHDVGSIAVKDQGGNSLLEIAATYGTADTVSFVLSQKDWPVEDINIALKSAIESDNLQAVQILLNAGGNFVTVGDNWVVFDNVLDGATSSGDLDMIALLCQYGYPINDETVWYAMKNAAKHGQTGVIRYFVEKGYNADYNADNTDGDTSVLYDACWAEQVNTVEYLLKIGCGIHSSQKALPPAVETGNIDLVKLLLDNGADSKEQTVHSDGSKGETSERIALQNGFGEILAMLNK